MTFPESTNNSKRGSQSRPFLPLGSTRLTCFHQTVNRFEISQSITWISCKRDGASLADAEWDLMVVFLNFKDSCFCLRGVDRTSVRMNTRPESESELELVLLQLSPSSLSIELESIYSEITEFFCLYLDCPIGIRANPAPDETLWVP